MISAAFFAIVGVDRSILLLFFWPNRKKLEFEKLGRSRCLDNTSTTAAAAHGFFVLTSCLPVF